MRAESHQTVTDVHGDETISLSRLLSGPSTGGHVSKYVSICDEGIWVSEQN
jgi:hypothetical protein